MSIEKEKSGKQLERLFALIEGNAVIYNEIRKQNTYLIPNLEETKNTTYTKEASFWEKGGCDTQSLASFNPPVEDVKTAFKEAFDLDSTNYRVLVFAAYCHKFARLVQDAGFYVLSSDPCKRWAKEGRKKGIKETAQLGVEDTPWIANLLAYVGFEPIPLDLNTFAGYLGLLKALAQTKKGYTEFSDISELSGRGVIWSENLDDHLIKIEHPLRDTKFDIANKIYGSKTEQSYNRSFVVDVAYTNKKIKEIAQTDLSLIKYLQNEEIISLEQIEASLGIKRKAALESLDRVDKSVKEYNIKVALPIFVEVHSLNAR